jgi:hypothetical protein
MGGGKNLRPPGTYNRSVLTQVLIYHWRRDDSGCGCGWGDRVETLGASWSEHVADVYEASVEAVQGGVSG